MPKKPIKSISRQKTATNSAYEFVAFAGEKNADSDASFLNSKVMAIQTTRHAPCQASCNADSLYQGFNLGLHVGDSSKQVADNRQYLQTLLPPQTNIQWLDQVHGNHVIYVDQVSAQPMTADAVITNKKNIALAVMTADCLPILLTAKNGAEIAAIHGGWRPLSTNIVGNTLSKMQTHAEEVYAWLGPCIGKNAFEVGEEVKAIFVALNPLFAQAFTRHGENKYLADLQKIAKLQLVQAGVEHVTTLAECTFANTDKYYSYRKNPITGRMASLICLQ